MRAVVMKEFGPVENLVMEEVSKPIPSDGEVRIRIKAAGFNPVDWKIREKWYGGEPGQILGSDCSGVIDQVGPNVKGFAVGDEVYAMTFMQCSNGSYAEFVTIPSVLISKKPHNLTFEQAAAVPLAAMTAYRATRAIKKGIPSLLQEPEEEWDRLRFSSLKWQEQKRFFP